MARTLRSVILRLSLFAHLYNGEAFLHDLFHIYNRSKYRLLSLYNIIESVKHV